MIPQSIEYRPCRSFLFLAALAVILSVLLAALFPWSASSTLSTRIFILICILFILFVAFYLYFASKTIVLFDEGGVRITSRSDSRYFAWKDMPRAYYGRSSQGHLFLVLTPDSTGIDEATRLIQKGMSKRGIRPFLTENAAVIYLDEQQDTTSIKAFVKQKVPSVFSI